MESGAPILLYDGVCALCNGAVRFVLARDRRGTLRFAALQGSTAADVRRRHPRLASEDTMVWVEPSGAIRLRSDAAIAAGRYLGGFWGALASLAAIVPRFPRDAVYDFVAHVRYKTFGKYAACPIPAAEHRARFLD